MTHKEAFERMKELSNGAYCSLNYESTHYGASGRDEHEIVAYINFAEIECVHIQGKTYAQVIAGMEAQLGIGYQEPPEVEDAG